MQCSWEGVGCGETRKAFSRRSEVDVNDQPTEDKPTMKWSDKRISCGLKMSLILQMYLHWLKLSFMEQRLREATRSACG